MPEASTQLVECGPLCQSFAEYSIAWLLLSGIISGLVGGLLGSSIKFAFEDFFRSRFNRKVESKKVLDVYRIPLSRSAESLENRINNILRSTDFATEFENEYYRFSTIYVFADFLAWAQIIEDNLRHFGTAQSAVASRIEKALRRTRGAFTSINYFEGYFEDVAASEASSVRHHIIDAVSESMLDRSSSNDASKVIGFGEFVSRYEEDPKMRRWIDMMSDYLRKADDDLVNDRLVMAGLALIRLLDELDPQRKLTKRVSPRNLDKIRNPTLKAFYDQKSEPGSRLQFPPDRPVDSTKTAAETKPRSKRPAGPSDSWLW